jgi:hypothetical protein
MASVLSYFLYKKRNSITSKSLLKLRYDAEQMHDLHDKKSVVFAIEDASVFSFLVTGIAA